MQHYIDLPLLLDEFSEIIAEKLVDVDAVGVFGL
jgi:hypothetical protein